LVLEGGSGKGEDHNQKDEKDDGVGTEHPQIFGRSHRVLAEVGTWLLWFVKVQSSSGIFRDLESHSTEGPDKSTFRDLESLSGIYPGTKVKPVEPSVDVDVLSISQPSGDRNDSKSELKDSDKDHDVASIHQVLSVPSAFLLGLFHSHDLALLLEVGVSVARDHGLLLGRSLRRKSRILGLFHTINY
jgi:hypothetical protein